MSNPRNIIIIVDDNLTSLTAGRNILKTFYQVIPVSSAKGMFETLETVIPDLILLDIEMPEMDGYEALQKLKADPRYADIPIMFLTAKDDAASELEGRDLGASDYITKPLFAPLLLKRIAREMQIVNQKKELLRVQSALKGSLEKMDAEVHEKSDMIYRMQKEILTDIADLVEMRDNTTGGHIVRTELYMKAMLDEMLKENIYTDEISEWKIEEVLSSAKLHDVGKITISDNILNKPGKLDADEYEIMKTHVLAGVDAIEKIMKNTYASDYMQHALCVIGTHHEKWDGSGYPIMLKGKNIPLEGRLMALTDVYDALVSSRPYKKAFTHEEACKIIEEGAGKHFDPALIGVFRSIKERFAEIKASNEN